MTKLSLRLTCGLAIATAILCGCDQLGIPDPSKAAAQADADGRAIGSACRHAGRAIEDCFTLNQSAQKAAVFAGWKDMNDYMLENKIVEVAPQLPPPLSPAAAKAAAKAKHAAEKAEAEGQSATDEPGNNTERESHGKTAVNTPADDPETPRKRRRSAE
jgi:hypothetical protein